MRKNSFKGWAATCVLAGATAASGSLSRSTAHAADSMALNQGAPQRTWSQRLMAPFSGASDPARAQRDAVAAGEAAEARRLAFDPLALSKGAGDASPQLYVGMAEMSSRGGNVPQARQFFQKALAMEPTHLDALLGAARMEDREGHMDVAVMLYQRAANAYPNNPTVLNDLALGLARQGQLPAAERALQRAIQIEPAKPLYRNNMAKVQIELGHLDVAVSNLSAVYPAPIVNYNMGVLLYQRGRTAESERFLTTALAMEPRMQEARAILAQMHPQAPVYQTARAPQSPLSISAPTQVVPEAPMAPTVMAEQPNSSQMIDTGAAAMPQLDTASAPTLLPPIK